MAAERFSLNDVLEQLQLAEDFSRTPADVYISPPDENNGQATDEDGGEEDGTDFNINNVGRKILNAESELVDVRRSQSSASRFYGGTRIKSAPIATTGDNSDEEQSGNLNGRRKFQVHREKGPGD